MAENDIAIQVGVVLDTDDIKSQLEAIGKGKENQVKVSVDLTDAKKAINEYKDELKNSKNPAKIAIDVLKGQSNTNIGNYVKEIQDKYQSSPIKITLDVDKNATTANINKAVGEIQQQVQKAVDQAVKSAGSVAGSSTTATASSSLSLPNASGDTKYWDELNDAIRRYSSAFDDVSAKVASWRISEDMEGNARAAVEFKNSVGEITTAIFRLQDALDAENKPILDENGNTIKEWVEVGNQYTKSFQAAEQAARKMYEELNKGYRESEKQAEQQYQMYDKMFAKIEQGAQKTSDYLSKQADEFKRLYSTASEQVNPSTGEFNEKVYSALMRYQNEYQKVAQSGANITEDQKRKIEELRQAIVSAIKEQQQLIQQEDYLSKKRADYNKLYSDAFVQNPLTGEYAEKALEALQKYQTKYMEISRSGIQLTAGQKREVEELGKAAALAIQEQHKAQDRYNKSVEDQRKVLSSIQEEYNKVSKIENQAFGGTNALTGDFRKKAEEEIEAVRLKFAEIKKAAEESFEGAANVSKEQLKKITDDLTVAINALQKRQYPADKIAAVDVETKKASVINELNEQEEKLKSLNQTSSEFADRLRQLREELSGLGRVDSDVDAWAKWRNEFNLLEQDIKKFEASAQGMGQKLAAGLENNQLQQITEMVDRLNNIDEKFNGAGVERLQQSLQSLALEYINVIEQLQNPNLSKDEYDALTSKVKELSDQFKQAQNAVKIFNDGFKNEGDLKKYEQSADALRLRFEQLQRTYANLANKNPEIADRFREVENAINGMDPNNIDEVTRQVGNLAKECGNASGQSAGLRGALTDAFGGLGSYLARFTSSYYIITKTIQGIKKMVNAVKEVDTSLVELQKVTNLTGHSLTQFTDKAYQMGAQLGRTGKDVIDAATTFSRAGYDLNEATQLAQSALVMTNVGVDIPNMESAASDMISILKAFDIQAEESMDVIDKLYNVANKEPLDFGNITQMLVTAGGTLAQTGSSLEETMGLLTGAFATMRSPAVANG